MHLEAKLDLLDMLQRYCHYGWSKKAICRKWEVSVHTFYGLKEFTRKEKMPQVTQLSMITEEEKQQVVGYALSHTEVNHREMSYRMIDEDVAYVSPSSVYRILKENNLVDRRGRKDKPSKWNLHERLNAPDQVWQTDLMCIYYRGRDYYCLSYIDIYSRFVVYQELCLTMTGDSIREATHRALQTSGKKPQIIQSDNGSCYISNEYRSFLAQTEIEHRRIHPHCPNENAEIERYHRTLRELVDTDDAEDFGQLHELIKERNAYYNHKRYHSAIEYITPWAKYSGQAKQIIESRKQKLEKAKQQRFRTNSKRLKEQTISMPKAA